MPDDPQVFQDFKWKLCPFQGVMKTGDGIHDGRGFIETGDDK